ncbi:MAG: DNA/RNA nuclease SfsA [Clostridia bacterium]|nr:DNA/RNA nuclease SfsA [Clostridia bacterium]
MKYKNVKEARFISRPNRFIAKVDIDGEEITVHVKNTGRCRELLVPGCRVFLERAENPERKTPYDLIAVEKIREDGKALLINMDSQVVNAAAEEWLKKGELFSHSAIIRREVTYENSRFDFYIEDGDEKAFLEVKGVTLERGGEVLFPDAPTERGVKHLRELCECIKDGYSAYVLFVIQMKGVTHFRPNDEMHRAFGDALREADRAGVKILAMDCNIEPDTIEIDKEIKVIL